MAAIFNCFRMLTKRCPASFVLKVQYFHKIGHSDYLSWVKIIRIETGQLIENSTLAFSEKHNESAKSVPIW